MPFVATVSGSPVPASRTLSLVEYAGRKLMTRGFEVGLINVRDLAADALFSANPRALAVESALATITKADAVVIATPVYNASYTGVLKAFLDLLPQLGLRGKSVLPLATGGSLAHVLSLDYALRPVLSCLGASHVVSSFFILDEWIGFDDAGMACLVREAEERLNSVIEELADSVSWRRSGAMLAAGSTV